MTDEPLIFPVGHYLGPRFDDESDASGHHQIRLGRSVARLQDRDQYAVWLLCHGAGRTAPDDRWTRQRVIDQSASVDGLSDVPAIIDALVRAGVVTTVDESDPARLRAFARAHRLQSLMLGTGNAPSHRERYGIGYPTMRPTAEVTIRAFHLWQWGHLDDTLWDAGELAARQWRDHGSRRARDASTDAHLRAFAIELQTLIAGGAAYLDHPVTYD